MKNLEALIDKLFITKTAKNFAIKVGLGDRVLYEGYHSVNGNINADTLFDMASVTKILATTSLCLIAFDLGLLDLHTKVSMFYKCQKQKESLEIYHLLTHTMGFGHKALNCEQNNYQNIAEQILAIENDLPIGSEVIYSCPGFIVLGKILEKVMGDRLDNLFNKYVCSPLGLTKTSFCPKDKTNIVNSNASPLLLGVVNDYNCQHLGGVAGNAGVFSNINDLTRFAQMLLNYGKPIISEATFKAAIKNYTPNMSEARGLGFLYVDERYPQTGKLFGPSSFGHCGHTGQSIFVDPKTKLYAIVLSDATITVLDYDKVMKMREDIHNAIKKDLCDII